MKTTGNTILITGGGSGIGFEMAKVFLQAGNQVIIVGRNLQKLQAAAADNPAIRYIQCDVSRPEEVDQLVAQIRTDFPEVNILVNNAGYARLQKLGDGTRVYEHAKKEMETNYLAPVYLTEKLLPLLEKHAQAAVVNVSSITAFAASLSLPTYSVSKAALHAYSQILRLNLALSGKVEVFEVMPPLVDTEFARDIKSEDKIAPSVVANELIDALENDRYEIHIGTTQSIYQLFLNSPQKALMALNRIPEQA